MFSKCLRYSLIFLQVLAFIFGLIMVIAGSVIQSKITTNSLARTVGGYSLTAGAVICIIFGLFVLAMSLFGLYATINDHHRFLVIYAGFMSVVFVIQFITGITGLSVYHSAKFNTYIEDVFEAEFKPNATVADNESNNYQSNLHCCGWEDFNSWKVNTTGSAFFDIPKSCCKNETDCDLTNPDEATWKSKIYSVGCKSKIMPLVKDIIEVVCGILVAFSVFNFIGIITSVVISNKLRTGYQFA